jgi:hypothetical protein
MEYMAIHTTPEGRRILPLCIEGRNLIDSKTYPRKGGRPWKHAVYKELSILKIAGHGHG